MSLVTSLSRECEIFDFNVDIDKIDLSLNVLKKLSEKKCDVSKNLNVPEILLGGTQCGKKIE